MSITLEWIQISIPNFMGRCITAMRRWPADQKSKPEVKSRDVIKWVSGAYVLTSVTIADIWTKFYIAFKHYTLNMTECSKFTWLKIQDGGGRRLVFWKMPITPNWIELFSQNLVGRCITAMHRWHMIKTRNRNFFCVTSLWWWIKMYILTECREHNRCADGSRPTTYKSSQLKNL